MTGIDELTPEDLTDAAYSAGVVFNGLTVTRDQTREFMKYGATPSLLHDIARDIAAAQPGNDYREVGQLASVRHNVNLLHDLRAMAHTTLVIAQNLTRPGQLGAKLLSRINASASRTASLHPGRLRQAVDAIGVDTDYGHYEPPPIDEADLTHTCRFYDPEPRDSSMETDPLNLFTALATVQPFLDGNKRTALFAANVLMLQRSRYTGKPIQLLTVPMDPLGNDQHPVINEHGIAGGEAAVKFHDLLARIYLQQPDSSWKHKTDQGWAISQPPSEPARRHIHTKNNPYLELVNLVHNSGALVTIEKPDSERTPGPGNKTSKPSETYDYRYSRTPHSDDLEPTL